MASREIEKERRKEKHSLQRKRPHLVASPTILIVCEGENTEPSFSNQLKLRSATIQAIGEGYNTLSLVKRAEALAKKTRYDEVWCVFDKDDFALHDFNQALQIAKTKKIWLSIHIKLLNFGFSCTSTIIKEELFIGADTTKC